MRVWWVGMREQLRLPVLVLLVGLRAPDAARAAARMAVPKLQSFGRPGWKDGNRLSPPQPSQVWQLAYVLARPNSNRSGQKQELPSNIFETIIFRLCLRQSGSHSVREELGHCFSIREDIILWDLMLWLVWLWLLWFY